MVEQYQITRIAPTSTDNVEAGSTGQILFNLPRCQMHRDSIMQITYDIAATGAATDSTYLRTECAPGCGVRFDDPTTSGISQVIINGQQVFQSNALSLLQMAYTQKFRNQKIIGPFGGIPDGKGVSVKSGIFGAKNAGATVTRQFKICDFFPFLFLQDEVFKEVDSGQFIIPVFATNVAATYTDATGAPVGYANAKLTFVLFIKSPTIPLPPHQLTSRYTDQKFTGGTSTTLNYNKGVDMDGLSQYQAVILVTKPTSSTNQPDDPLVKAQINRNQFNLCYNGSEQETISSLQAASGLNASDTNYNNSLGILDIIAQGGTTLSFTGTCQSSQTNTVAIIGVQITANNMGGLPLQ